VRSVLRRTSEGAKGEPEPAGSIACFAGWRLDLGSYELMSPDDRSVDVLVGKLRKKIERDPKEPRLIETVRGVGYRLTAKVLYE
jgi:hypothetical protein